MYVRYHYHILIELNLLPSLLFCFTVILLLVHEFFSSNIRSFRYISTVIPVASSGTFFFHQIDACGFINILSIINRHPVCLAVAET